MQERNWIHTFAITIAAIGGIGFLIAGAVFAVPDIYAYLPTKHYNWILVVIGEGGTLFTVASFLALASILDQQKEMVNAIRKLTCESTISRVSDEPLAIEQKQASEPAKPTDTTAFGYVICPHCQEVQSPSTLFCNVCGEKLK